MVTIKNKTNNQEKIVVKEIVEETTLDPTPVPTPEPTPEPISVPKETVVKEVIIEKKEEVAQPSPLSVIDKLKAEGSPKMKSFIARFETYKNTLQPGKIIDPDIGARAEMSFWRTLQDIAQTTPYSEFKALWNVFLGFVKEHQGSGVLNDRYVFRFFSHWTFPQSDAEGFQAIINLAKLTCEPATRPAGLKQIDLERAFKKGLTEQARQNLLMFYNQ